MNPFLKRQQKNQIGKSGRKSETKTSERLGGKQTPASGALDGAKGDIMLNDFLIEAKSTVKDSISLKLEWLKKISGEALAKQKSPAIALTFTKGNGEPKDRGRWIAIPEYLFKELIDE